jgi:hypothetical protein
MGRLRPLAARLRFGIGLVHGVPAASAGGRECLLVGRWLSDTTVPGVAARSRSSPPRAAVSMALLVDRRRTRAARRGM